MSQEEFDQTAKQVRELPESVAISDEDKLKIYGLYKQATVGDVNIEQPGMFKLKEKKKWEAWNDQKGKSKEQARKEYIETAKMYIPSTEQK